MMVVFAAGNSGTDAAWYPAYYSKTIAVVKNGEKKSASRENAPLRAKMLRGRRHSGEDDEHPQIVGLAANKIAVES